MKISKKALLLPAFAAMLALPTLEAAAKCTVTLKFVNKNSKDATALGAKSQSRINGGLWSKMNFSNVTVKPGQSKTVPWTLKMSCGGSKKRDLRIKYQESGTNQIYQENVDNIDIEDGLTYTVTLKH